MFRAVIVDDEPYMREGLRLLVDWQACAFDLVGEAADAHEALALIHRERPDLAILDIRMPGMEGTKLAQLLTDQHPELLVMFMTGYQDFEYARAAIRAHAWRYLLKPLDPEELEKELRIAAAHLVQRSKGQEAGDAAITPSSRPIDDSLAQPPLSEADWRPRMEQYIQAHYAGTPSIAALSREIGFHKGYLGQLIKRETGQSFHQHVTQARMEKARQLLRQTSLSIAEVASAVGIHDVDYFTSQFKRITGSTPSAYRRQ